MFKKLTTDNLAKRKVATRTILKVMLSALDNAEFPSPRQS